MQLRAQSQALLPEPWGCRAIRGQVSAMVFNLLRAGRARPEAPSGALSSSQRGRCFPLQAGRVRPSPVPGEGGGRLAQPLRARLGALGVGDSDTAAQEAVGWSCGRTGRSQQQLRIPRHRQGGMWPPRPRVLSALGSGSGCLRVCVGGGSLQDTPGGVFRAVRVGMPTTRLPHLAVGNLRHCACGTLGLERLHVPASLGRSLERPGAGGDPGGPRDTQPSWHFLPRARGGW